MYDGFRLVSCQIKTAFSVQQNTPMQLTYQPVVTSSCSWGIPLYIPSSPAVCLPPSVNLLTYLLTYLRAPVYRCGNVNKPEDLVWGSDVCLRWWNRSSTSSLSAAAAAVRVGLCSVLERPWVTSDLCEGDASLTFSRRVYSASVSLSAYTAGLSRDHDLCTTPYYVIIIIIIITGAVLDRIFINY